MKGTATLPRSPARVAATAAVAAVVVIAQVGLVVAPSQLASQPMLVLALRPTPAFLILVSGSIAPLTAIAVAAFGRTLVDVAYFAVARHGGLPLAQRFSLGRDMSRGLSRTTTTRGLLTLLFFWSSTPVIVALGLGRTPAPTFTAVTGAGNILTSAAFVFFGRQLSEQVTPISAFVSGHSIELTFGLAIAVTAMAAAAASRRRRSSPPASTQPGPHQDQTPFGHGELQPGAGARRVEAAGVAARQKGEMT